MVIAIIALLVGMLVPSLQQAKGLAIQAQCFGMEHAQISGLHQYLADFDGRFPEKAVWYTYSPTKPGPDWTQRTKYEDQHEGIGDYLSAGGGSYYCTAAAAYENQHSWGISPGTFATYTPNRSVIQYSPIAESNSKYRRYAHKEDNINRPGEVWIFADGNWRGTFSAFTLYHDSYARFFWGAHFEGADVVYLDGHAEWISSSRNVHPSDWGNSPINWCAMKSSNTMWE